MRKLARISLSVFALVLANVAMSQSGERVFQKEYVVYFTQLQNLKVYVELKDKSYKFVFTTTVQDSHDSAPEEIIEKDSFELVQLEIRSFLFRSTPILRQRVNDGNDFSHFLSGIFTDIYAYFLTEGDKETPPAGRIVLKDQFYLSEQFIKPIHVPKFNHVLIDSINHFNTQICRLFSLMNFDCCDDSCTCDKIRLIKKLYGRFLPDSLSYGRQNEYYISRGLIAPINCFAYNLDSALKQCGDLYRFNCMGSFRLNCNNLFNTNNCSSGWNTLHLTGKQVKRMLRKLKHCRSNRLIKKGYQDKAIYVSIPRPQRNQLPNRIIKFNLENSLRTEAKSETLSLKKVYHKDEINSIKDSDSYTLVYITDGLGTRKNLLRETHLMKIRYSIHNMKAQLQGAYIQKLILCNEASRIKDSLDRLCCQRRECLLEREKLDANIDHVRLDSIRLDTIIANRFDKLQHDINQTLKLAICSIPCDSKQSLPKELYFFSVQKDKRMDTLTTYLSYFKSVRDCARDSSNVLKGIQSVSHQLSTRQMTFLDQYKKMVDFTDTMEYQLKMQSDSLYRFDTIEKRLRKDRQKQYVNNHRITAYIRDAYSGNMFLVDSSQMEFSEGTLKNIEVYGKYGDKSYVLSNRLPIPISAKTDKETFSRFKLYELHGYRFTVPLDKVIDYYPYLHLHSEDYSPVDSVYILKPKDTPKMLFKERTVNILKGRIFTDLIGFSKDAPNGLVQAEISRRFNLYTKFFPVLYRRPGKRPGYKSHIGLFNYYEPILLISKIEDKVRSLPIDTTQIPGFPTQIRFASTLNYFRYAYFYFKPVNFNIISFHLPLLKLSLHLDAGVSWSRTSLVDTIKTGSGNKEARKQDVNLMNFEGSIIFQGRPDPRFGFNISNNFIFVKLWSYDFRQAGSPQSFQNGTDMRQLNWLYNFQLNAFYKPFRGSTGEMFFRFSFYATIYNPAQNFMQAQLGYAFKILK